MSDFWLSSGYCLLDRGRSGRLVVTDAFLKAYLVRPELIPPEDACPAERRLHDDLLNRGPRRPVGREEIAAIADPGARENWGFMIAFRDLVLSEPTLEDAYLDLARGAGPQVPPLFMNQLAHVVLRNALDGEADPFVLRGAELFFRPQRATVHEGRLLLADAELIEMHEEERRAYPLVGMLGGPAVTALDILDPSGRDGYFARSDAFDLVLDLGLHEARRGIANALAAWTRHLLDLTVTIEPVDRIEDEPWSWFVGLDADATQVGNALWRGEEPEREALDRVIALFRLDLPDRARVLPQLAGRPVWLILAMTPERKVRMKPQNLAVGLPLREAAVTGARRRG